MSTDDLEVALLQEISRIVSEPVTELDPSRSLSELGLDSVGYCTVSAFIEKRFGVAVRPEKLFEFSSVGDTALHVAALLEGGETEAAQPLVSESAASCEVEHPYTDRDIAIIGLALDLPGADTPERYWDLITRGDSVIAAFPAERVPENAADERPRFLKGGFLENIAAFDAAFFGISPREAIPMDPQQRLFLECAFHTFESAGYSLTRLSGSNTAVFVGASGFDYYELLLRSQAARTTHIGTGVSHAVIANRVSQYFNLKGASEAVDTACSSGLVALWRGVETLRRGESELSLVGGVNVLASRTPFQVFADAGMLSQDGVCRPFDAQAAGYVRGEGVGAVLLKRATDAVRDGDRIWAIIKGGAVRHSGRTNSLTAPNPDAQADVIAAAVLDAGIDPLSISYVEAHGTGTALGDPIEANGLGRAFRRLHTVWGRERVLPHFRVGSVKAQIGHLEAAAGLAGLLKAVLALTHRVLPGSPYLTTLNPHIDLTDACFRFASEATAWSDRALPEQPRRAGVSSFGFGGVNAHVVLEEAAAPARAQVASGPKLVVLSAKSATALQQRARTLAARLSSQNFASEDDARTYLADLAFTLHRATPFSHRLAVVTNSIADLIEKLTPGSDGSFAPGVLSGTIRAGRHEALSLFSSEAELEQRLRTLAAAGELHKLSTLWVEGLPIDWPSVLPRGGAALLSLPGYAFDRGSFWVSYNSSEVSAPTVPWRLYESAWQERSLADTGEPGAPDGVVVALVSGPRGRRVAELMHSGRQLLVVSLEEGSTASSVAESAGAISGFLDLTAFEGVIEEHSEAARMRLEFVRELLGGRLKKGEQLDLLQATLGLSCAADGSSPTTLAGAQESGVYKSLWAEYRRCRSKTLDFAPADFTPEGAAAVLSSELRLHDGPSELRYQGQRRFARVLRALPSHAPESESEPGGVALITGASGEIGLGLACDLAARGFGALLLTGRRVLTPAQQQRIDDLMRRGTAVAFFRGDLCDEAAFGTAIEHFRNAHGPITHVYHCAGAVSHAAPAFFQKTAATMADVARPKVDALWVLHHLLESAPPRVFMLFSSVSALAPKLAAGLLDYAAANRFLDLFAQYQHAQGNRYYRSVQWSRWRDLGLARDARAGAELGVALDAAQCFAALHHISAATELVPVICVAAANDAALTTAALERPRIGESTPRAKPPLAVVGDRAELDTVRAKVRSIIAKELELPESKLDEQASFEDLGVDSIVLIGVVTQLERWLDAKVDPSELMKRNSIAAVVSHLAERYAPAARTVESEATPVTPPREPAVSADRPAPAVGAGSFRVAVIGIACRFPGASDKETFWRNLVAGRDSVSTVPASRWDSQALYADRHQPGRTVSQWGGFIDGVERVNPSLFGLRPEDAADLDPLIRLFTEASLAVVTDSPYDRESLAGRRVGVFAGARGSRYAERICSPGKHSVTGVGQNFIAAFVSHLLDLRGPSLVLDSACSSSLAAVHLACQSLHSGDSELAIAGGVDLLLDEKPYLFLSAAHALSPDGRCRTFDEKANGFVPGEGVGCVLLKPLDQALADGDHVYAVIDGSAINNDGHTLGITTPGVEGQVDVIERALQKADVAPSTISYIETHGTGTMIGDPIELRALSRAFAKDPPSHCALGSVKTNVGHLLSAAGIASFIKVALALHHGILPPTLHCEHVNPRFEFEKTPFLPLLETRPWGAEAGVRRAGISAFGFGKTNVHLILSERPTTAARPLDLEAAPVPEGEAEKIYSWHPAPQTPWLPSVGLLGLEALSFESLDEA